MSGKSILKGEETVVKPKLIHRLLEENMDSLKFHDEEALIEEAEDNVKQSSKFSSLNKNANEIANGILEVIRTNEAQPNIDGDWIVVVCMKPSIHLVTTLLAILKAGAAYLPIDTEAPQNCIARILKEAKPILVIHDESHSHPEYFSPITAITYETISKQSLDKDVEDIADQSTLNKGDPRSMALILYTSGSSGYPKGVRLSHQKINQRNQWQLRKYPFGTTEKNCVFKTALTFVDHFGEIWCPLVTGRTLVIIPKCIVQNPEQFVPILEKYKIERLLSVPTILRNILMHLKMQRRSNSEVPLANLKLWISSGEPLAMDLAQEFFDFFQDHRTLVNVYGSTEMSADASSIEFHLKQDLSSHQQIPIGTSVDNAIIYVMDENMKLVDEGEIGEILVAGELIVVGYVNNESPGSFLKNPLQPNESYSQLYKTGDFGFVKNGILYYEGRRDTQIKIRGIRIDLSEVEQSINELRYVGNSVILVYRSRIVDQALVAFITLKNNSVKTQAEIEADLRTKLVPYMVPQVVLLEQFPYLDNGKVDRQQLLNKFQDLTESIRNSKNKVSDLKDVPKDKLGIAEEVFSIIEEGVGSELRSAISTQENFFELGGNSLNLIYTVAQLRNKGFNISLADFLKAKNIGEVLEKISTVEAPRSEKMIMKQELKLFSERLDHKHKEEAMRMVATSFLKKGDLDMWLSGRSIDSYLQIFNKFIDDVVEAGISFIVKNVKGEMVGVTVNFDLVLEPEFSVPPCLVPMFNLLVHIEQPVVKNIIKPALGEVMYSFMMGTAENLSTRDNIDVISFMEAEDFKVAKSNGFKKIFTTNTNPCTQQIGVHVLGYEILNDFQVNTFDIRDEEGNRPFAKAPDSQRVIVAIRDVE